MADATEILVGRSVGHDWAVLVAASGHFYWPLVGRNKWPLTTVPPNCTLRFAESGEVLGGPLQRWGKMTLLMDARMHPRSDWKSKIAQVHHKVSPEK